MPLFYWGSKKKIQDGGCADSNLFSTLAYLASNFMAWTAASTTRMKAEPLEELLTQHNQPGNMISLT